MALASTWNDPAGGDWHDATNWLPMAVPNGSSIDALISAAGRYTVYTYVGETYTLHDLTLSSANATLSNAGDLTIKHLVTVTNGTFLQYGFLDLSASGAGVVVTGGTFHLQGATVRGGTLAQSGSGVLEALGGTTTFDGTGAGGVTLAAGSTLTVGGNSNVALSGSFVNAGTVALAVTGGNVGLVINNSVTLTGGGTITLGASPSYPSIGSGIRSDVQGTLSTLDNVDNTISGAGTISGDSTPSFGTLAVINRAAGVINATSASQPLTIQNMTLTNYGLVEATGAGGLVFGSYSVAMILDQTVGGTLKAVGSGSHVDLTQGATVKGGTITTSGGGFVNAANAIFDGTAAGGLTLTAGSDIRLLNGTSLTLTGTIANAGTISLNGTDSNTRLLVTGATSLTGGGSIVLNGGPNHLSSFVTGSSLDNVDNTISGSGEIALDNLLLTNEAGGTINASSASAALTIDSFGANNTLINKGLVEATGAGGLALNGIILDQTGGGTLKAVGSGRTVTLTSTTVKGGTVATSGGGLIQIGAYTNVFDGTGTGGLKLASGAQVRVLNGNGLHLAGAIANAGTISLAASGNATSLILDATTTLTGSGKIVLGNGAGNQIYASAAGSLLDNVNNTISGAGTIAIGNLSLTNEVGGTINANGTSALIIDGGFTNYGLIEATGSGVLQINNTLTNIGVIQGVITQNGNQTIVNADAVGQLTLTGGTGDNRLVATIAPTHADGGAGTDTLVIAANMAIAAGSLVSIETIEVANGVTADLSALTTGMNITLASTAGGGSTVFGTKGADTITSGAGIDAMHGGLGNDSYFVDNSGDLVFEIAGQGTDTVFARTSYALQAGQSVETLRASSVASTVAMNLTGNELAQTLLGNAGANILDGGGGGDRMTGYGGDDTYVINSSSDLVFEAAGQGTDTINSRVSYVLAAGQSVETLKFTSVSGTGNLNLTGNEIAQTLLGNNGNNVLDGGGGGDTMRGYGGDDTYVINSSSDLVFEASGQGTDIVNSRVSYVLAAGQSVETLKFTSVSGTGNLNLTGNEFAQTLTGNAGNNILDGGGGGDTMRGYAGDDTYVINSASDLVFESNGQGSDTVNSRVSYTLAAGQSVETLKFTSTSGTGNLNLTGNELAQTISGNNGNNILDGKGGADILRGYGGSDTFVFSTTLGASNIDHIVDFSTTADTIRLDQTIFAALGLGALNVDAFKDIGVAGAVVDSTDRILYDHNTGALYYDADGSGTAARIQFAVLDNKPTTLTHADFFVVA